MSFGNNKRLWLSLAAVVVAVGALIWLLFTGGPLTLVILFADAGDLKRDDPVIWHDFTIGRVIKVEPLVENQVGVTIRLNEDYATRITQGTRFTLKRAALFGIVGSNAITIETPSEPGRPYTRGERIQGISPPKPTLVEQGKQVTLEYWQQLKAQAAALLEEYRQSPYRPEVEDALGQLKSLAEEGAKQTKEGLEKFRKDHQKDFDAVLNKLEQARDWMLRKGDQAGATKIQKEIDKLRK